MWMLLGEAKSKCEHIAGTPLWPEFAKELHEVFLAKGARATTAIEGNTLSEEEVRQLIDGELTLPPSREYLATEVENILRACNHIVDEIRLGNRIELTPARIAELNQDVLNGLEVPESVVPGEIRQIVVGVGHYRAPAPLECQQLLGSLCDWVNGPDFVPSQKEMRLPYAFLKAILVHLYIAWIHPFGDGNGRTARLLEFQILVGSGVPSPAAHLLSNHYNLTRAEYYRQLDAASASGGELVPFIKYALQGLVDGLKLQLQTIKRQQLDLTWESYVYRRFGSTPSPAEVRRRLVALDLSKRADPVPLKEMMELSPRVAAQYGKRTQRALIRDLRDLITMGLIRKRTVGYVANKEQIYAFLPVTAKPDD